MPYEPTVMPDSPVVVRSAISSEARGAVMLLKQVQKGALPLDVQ